MLQEIINKLDPRKVKWWNKDEWYRQEKFDAHYVVEENGCSSWDVEICEVIWYKNKDSCKERVRYEKKEYPLPTTTVFENPKKGKVSWWGGALKTRHIDQIKIYEGPDWERK